jgi:hypothetical protein
MTVDYAVALSLLDDQLRKPGLTAVFSPKIPSSWSEPLPWSRSRRPFRGQAEAAGIHVLPWNDPRFPTLLGAITDCPPVLWYRGELSALDAPTVAIVGSRAATSVSVDTAERLARDLAARGITVVSGLARGV